MPSWPKRRGSAFAHCSNSAKVCGGLATRAGSQAIATWLLNIGITRRSAC
jgi:hypothetical protein